jgi:hypothetical protein
MPIATRSVSEVTSPARPPTVTPAESNANTGTATPADTGRKRCSKCSASPGPASWTPARRAGSTGTAKPSSTPATVAGTPEACTSVQVAAASGSSSGQERTRRCTSTVNADSGSNAASSGSADSCAV